MNHTQLNDDVFLHIASFADKDTLCILMRTCPLLLHYGGRRLLEDGVSLDEDNRRIWSFVAFMLKRGHSYRIKLLHSFRLTTPYYCSPAPIPLRATGMALATLFRSLAKSGDLRNLCIIGSEQLLRLHPSVPAAISTITTLELLNVMEAGLYTVNMLGRLRSPLTRATITLVSPRREEGKMLSVYARNPMCFLRNFSNTLSRVSVKYSTSALVVGPWYPHVTYLHLNSADILHTYHYVRAFPNLQVLSTKDCGVMVLNKEYEPRRAHNMMEQTAFGTWTSLNSYRGALLTLYLLGITRHIPKVVITHVEDTLEYEVLRTVLGDARPRRLELCLDGAFWLLDPGFWPTFTYDGVDALRYFEFCIMLDPLDDRTDIPAALEAAISHAIKPLRSLVAVRIAIDLSWYFAGRGPTLSAEGDPLLVPIEEVLLEWDMDAYAHRIQDEVGVSATALRSISVSLWNHRTRKNTTVTLGMKYKPDVHDGWSDDSESDDE